MEWFVLGLIINPIFSKRYMRSPDCTVTQVFNKYVYIAFVQF